MDGQSKAAPGPFPVRRTRPFRVGRKYMRSEDTHGPAVCHARDRQGPGSVAIFPLSDRVPTGGKERGRWCADGRPDIARSEHPAPKTRSAGQRRARGGTTHLLANAEKARGAPPGRGSTAVGGPEGGRHARHPGAHRASLKGGWGRAEALGPEPGTPAGFSHEAPVKARSITAPRHGKTAAFPSPRNQALDSWPPPLCWHPARRLALQRSESESANAWKTEPGVRTPTRSRNAGPRLLARARGGFCAPCRRGHRSA